MQGGFFYLLDSIRPFLAMAENEQVPLYSFIWLNENVQLLEAFLTAHFVTVTKGMFQEFPPVISKHKRYCVAYLGLL